MEVVAGLIRIAVQISEVRRQHKDRIESGKTKGIAAFVAELGVRLI